MRLGGDRRVGRPTGRTRHVAGGTPAASTISARCLLAAFLTAALCVEYIEATTGEASGTATLSARLQVNKKSADSLAGQTGQHKEVIGIFRKQAVAGSGATVRSSGGGSSRLIPAAARRQEKLGDVAIERRSIDGNRNSRQRRKAIREDLYYWPDARIPYEIDSSIDTISTTARAIIKKAIAHWEQMTCIRFVPYNATIHLNYLRILKGLWCASKLGMTGGQQPLYIAAGCLTIGTVIHEMGHSVGWVHEQTRPDRDEHVDINWSIISPLYRPQYDKYSGAHVNTYGIPYDHSSIMHYPSYGELTARDSAKQSIMGQRERLSFYDAKLANVMYKCAERRGCDTSNIECIGESYLGPDCKCVCPDGTAHCTATNDISMPTAAVAPVLPGDAAVPPNEPPADEDAAAVAARIRDSCEEWNRVENTFIVGYNDDVLFGVGVEECKARCKSESSFLCLSVNYWLERRHCYLSSASKRTHRKARVAHDERIMHFERNICGASVSKRPQADDKSYPTVSIGTSTRRPPENAAVATSAGGIGASRDDGGSVGGAVGAVQGRKPPPQQQQPPARPVETTAAANQSQVALTATPASVAPVGRRYAAKCPPEYTNVRDTCLRFVLSSTRPAPLAAHECKNRLQASLWNYTEALRSPLASHLPDGEYWVSVEDYKSDNSLAGFFRFCPYLLKANGVVVLSDNFCHLRKSFICTTESIRAAAPAGPAVRHDRLSKKAQSQPQNVVAAAAFGRP